MSKYNLLFSIVGICLSAQLMCMDANKKSRPYLLFELGFESSQIECDFPIRKVSAHNMGTIDLKEYEGKDFFDVGPIPVTNQSSNMDFVRACYYSMDNKKRVKVPFSLDTKAYLYALVQQNQRELKITPSETGWQGPVQLYVKVRPRKSDEKYTLQEVPSWYSGTNGRYVCVKNKE